MRRDTKELGPIGLMPSIALMRRDTQGLGPIGLIREGFKVFIAHFKFFLLVHLTLCFPPAIISVACESMIIWNLPQLLPPIPKGVSVHNSHNFVFAYLNLVDSPLQEAMFLVSIFFISTVGTIIYQGAINVSAAATQYAVGLHYTGRSASFKDVLKAALPNLWMRLTATTLCAVLLVQSFLLVHLVAYLVVKQYSATTLIMMTEWMLESLMALAIQLCISMIFGIATSVSVLEKDYGWAAVRKGLKLLKGRLKVALLFQLLWMVPTVLVEMGFKGILEREITQETAFSPGRWTLLLFYVILFSGWMTFVLLMTTILSGVQYVSFKAYHNEDLLESFSEKEAFQRAYGRVASDESDDGNV